MTLQCDYCEKEAIKFFVISAPPWRKSEAPQQEVILLCEIHNFPGYEKFTPLNSPEGRKIISKMVANKLKNPDGNMWLI